jgi:hypothetical protein
MIHLGDLALATHLGDAASALADAELDGLGPHGLERAEAHLAECSRCRAEVEQERRSKARLSWAAGAPALPDHALEALLRIGTGPAVTLGWPAPAGGPSPAVVRGVRRSRGRYVAVAGLAASVVVGLGAGGVSGAGSSGSAGGSGGSVSPAPSPVRPAAPSSTGVVLEARHVFDGRTRFDGSGRFDRTGALSLVYRRP